MIKLTPKMLRNLVESEMHKFGKMKKVEDVAKETPEVEAGEEAQHLSNKVNYVKALKIKEARLAKALKKVREDLDRARR